MRGAHGTCSIEGCGKPHHARGWCSEHYHRWKSQGDPLATKSRKCSVEDCDASSYARGWCRRHYRRWKLYGDPTFVLSDEDLKKRNRDSWTPERRRATSERNRKIWQDPGFRAQIVKTHVETWSNPKLREELSARWTEDEREAARLRGKARWEDPDFRDHMAKIKADPAVKAKASASRKASMTPERQAKQARITRELWKDPEYREKVLRAQDKEKAREKTKKLWEDPEYRAKVFPTLICQHCGRSVKGKGALNRHERSCKENPNRSPKPRPREGVVRAKPERSFIYCLVDPRVGEPRYVGWTTNPEGRLRRHMDDALKGEKSYRNAWIRSLLSENVEPKMIVLETNPPDYAEAERTWIARYRSEGHRLTNQTDGGDGAPGYRHTPETLQLLREMFTGKPLTQAHRDAISASQMGKPKDLTPEGRARLVANGKRLQTPENIAKSAAARRGKKQSPEVAAKSAENGRKALQEWNALQRERSNQRKG